MDDVKKKSDLLPDDKSKLSGIEKRNANLKPFKKYADMTPDEIAKQKEISKKAVDGVRRYHENKKTMKECALSLLETKLNRGQIEKLIGTENTDMLPDSMTVQELIMLKAFNEIMDNGSVRFAEFIRDTSGQLPKNQVEIQADIVTASDRALIDKVSKRLLTDKNSDFDD